MSDKSDNNKKLMIQTLEKSLGVVTTACKKVGISRQTHYRWMEEDKDYKQAVEDIKNVTIDFVESQLHMQIKDGNTAATIFYLKTQGKNRGYVERQELAVTQEQPLFPENEPDKDDTEEEQ